MSPPSRPPRSSGSDALAASASLLWLAALIGGIASADVPAWRGAGALLVGGALLAVRGPPMLRIACAAAAAAPLLLPALAPDRPGEGSVVVWLALGAAAAAGAMVDRRRAAVAAGCLGIVGVVAAKQAIGASLFPSAGDAVVGLAVLGWLGAALTLGTPPGRGAGVALVVAGALVAVRGPWVARAAADLPARDAAGLVARSGAFRAWPVVEARALDEIASGRLAGAFATVRAAPERTVVGEALVGRLGPDRVLDLGWSPVGPLDADVAIAVAWAFEARGEGGRGLALLRRQPRTGPIAWHTALLAGEVGDERTSRAAWARAAVPDDVPRAPAVLLEVAKWSSSTQAVLPFAAADGVREIVIAARGEPWGGDPVLEAQVAGRSWGPQPVGESRGTWTWAVDLPPGAYRLVLRYPNDANGSDGDRNLRDLRVEVR